MLEAIQTVEDTNVVIPTILKELYNQLAVLSCCLDVELVVNEITAIAREGNSLAGINNLMKWSVCHFVPLCAGEANEQVLRHTSDLCESVEVHVNRSLTCSVGANQSATLLGKHR